VPFGDGKPPKAIALRTDGIASAAPESVKLLDGGGQAYPRMLAGGRRKAA
jgi:hypothetical protein